MMRFNFFHRVEAHSLLQRKKKTIVNQELSYGNGTRDTQLNVVARNCIKTKCFGNCREGEKVNTT